jgi:hypothetical protein
MPMETRTCGVPFDWILLERPWKSHIDLGELSSFTSNHLILICFCFSDLPVYASCSNIGARWMHNVTCHWWLIDDRRRRNAMCGRIKLDTIVVVVHFHLMPSPSFCICICLPSSLFTICNCILLLLLYDIHFPIMLCMISVCLSPIPWCHIVFSVLLYKYKCW